MNKLLNIFVGSLVLIVIYAHSCAGEDESAVNDEKKITVEIDSISAEFQHNTLSAKSLIAFEANASQKLLDFSDYYNTLSDTGIDSAFKMKTAEMIRGLFVSDTVTHHVYSDLQHSDSKITLNHLLQSAIDGKSLVDKFLIDSIWIDKPFIKTKKQSYQTILYFRQKHIVFDTLTLPSNVEQKEMDVFVQRQNKIFGQDTLKIWGVRLGEIR